MVAMLRRGVHECGLPGAGLKAAIPLLLAFAVSLAEAHVVKVAVLDDAQNSAEVKGTEPVPSSEQLSLPMAMQSSGSRHRASLGPQLSATVRPRTGTATSEQGTVSIPMRRVSMPGGAGRLGLGLQLGSQVRPFRRVAPTAAARTMMGPQLSSQVRPFRLGSPAEGAWAGQPTSEIELDAAILGPQIALHVQMQEEPTANDTRTLALPLSASSHKSLGAARLGLGPQLSSKVGPRRSPPSAADASRAADDSESAGLISHISSVWHQSGSFQFFMLCLVVNALALMFLNSKFSSTCRPLARRKQRLFGMHVPDKRAASAPPSRWPDLASSCAEV